MKKLRQLINELEAAARADEIKGSKVEQSEIDSITTAYEEAKYNVALYIAQLMAAIEQLRKTSR